ncbi:hypothetical protein, partial [Pseudomonas frederiksbergensis]|uniref:hypothetical protein n=1 Tax=Pseudomonas frederiksbergensis TaxID=104087 RepID=UPI001C8333A9
TDECQLDELSGNAAVNGVPVTVAAACACLSGRPSMAFGFPLQCATVPTLESESSAEVLHEDHRND